MLELGGLVRRWRIIAATLLALALAGCSTLRLAYGQADTLVYWWADGYVDFTQAQAPHAREAIARWFEWHRRSELPDYAALLDTAAGEVLHDTTPQRLCAWTAELRVRIDRAVEQSLPVVATLAMGFDAAQLERLETRQAELAAEWREEFLRPDAQDRLEAAVRRVRERIEQLYGRLDEAQRESIRRSVSASPFDAQRWVSERERRQRDLAQVLRELHAAGATDRQAGASPERLRAVWQRVKQSPDPAFRRYQEELIAYNCARFAEFHNATSAEQRQAAQRRLKGWRADLLQLAAPA